MASASLGCHCDLDDVGPKYGHMITNPALCFVLPEFDNSFFFNGSFISLLLAYSRTTEIDMCIPCINACPAQETAHNNSKGSHS